MPGDIAGERHIVVKSQVLERYWRERPPNKIALGLWIERVAAELGLRANTVRRYVEDEEAANIRAIEGARTTSAQTIADMIGATQAKAIRKLSALIDAKKRRIMKDSHGNIVREYDPETKEYTGKPVYEVTDDNASQLSAIEKVLKIHGSYAPEQVQIESHSTVVHHDLTDEELKKKWLEKRTRIDQLMDAGSLDDGGRAGGIRAVGSGATGEEGQPGCVVLVDRVHEDV